jgi:poly(3-hydroxybutyrate) depolymerase
MRRRASVWAGSIAIGALLAAGLTTPASAAESELEPVAFPGVGTEVWLFDERAAYDFTKREPTIAPRYLIYPDRAVDAEGAKRVIEELGIDDHLTEYATRAWIINPTNGVDYQADADLASYFSFMSLLPTLADHQHTNVKVIGVGNGATFVNNVVSQNSWSLAGIFTYGGKMDSSVTPYGPSPAYIHGDVGAGKRYVAANSAEVISRDRGVTVYADPNEPLARVVVDPSRNETLAEAFDAAWDGVLSHVYRPHFPRGRVDPSVTREGFPLIEYPRIGEGYVTQTPVTDPLGTSSEYMWQEYIPASVLDAAPGTVPLLVAMHGTTDMPQHIAERGGWVEQIAEAGAMMVSVENQGTRFGFANFDGPATERLVALLAEKYPQLDTSRVYATGFSLGGANSQSWGISHPTLFTAVSGVGAPFGGGEGQIAQAAAAAKPNQEVPFYMLQGVEDGIGQLPVTASARSVYTTIRAYGALNGVDVPVTPDLSLNPHYGIALDDQQWETMGTNEALVGTLSNDRGVMIKLAGVNGLGHVSFAPSAADIWEFFEEYSRDVTTGELYFHP